MVVTMDRVPNTRTNWMTFEELVPLLTCIRLCKWKILTRLWSSKLTVAITATLTKSQTTLQALDSTNRISQRLWERYKAATIEGLGLSPLWVPALLWDSIIGRARIFTGLMMFISRAKQSSSQKRAWRSCWPSTVSLKPTRSRNGWSKRSNTTNSKNHLQPKAQIKHNLHLGCQELKSNI